jgi:hypothetical protein
MRKAVAKLRHDTYVYVQRTASVAFRVRNASQLVRIFVPLMRPVLVPSVSAASWVILQRSPSKGARFIYHEAAIDTRE